MPNGRSGGFLLPKTEFHELLSTLPGRCVIGRRMAPPADRHPTEIDSASLMRQLTAFPAEEVWVEEQEHSDYIVHLDRAAGDAGELDPARWILVRSDSPLFGPLRERHRHWQERPRPITSAAFPSPTLRTPSKLSEPRPASVDRLRCRMAACPSGETWDFHLINDSASPIHAAVLERVEWEWGDQTYGTQAPRTRVKDVAPGGSRRLWRGADEELRMTLFVVVEQGGRRVPLEFTFPLLYKRRDELSLIEELGVAGWVEGAEG